MKWNVCGKEKDLDYAENVLYIWLLLSHITHKKSWEKFFEKFVIHACVELFQLTYNLEFSVENIIFPKHSTRLTADSIILLIR